MDLGPTLEALGVDSLADLTLEKLQDKVQAVGLGGHNTIHIFMGWLNEQIKKDIPQDLTRFVRLLSLQFGGNEIRAVFEKWLKKDAEENPTCRRRYLIIEQEISEILKQTGYGSRKEATLFSFSESSHLRRKQDSSPGHPSDSRDLIEGTVDLSLDDINQMNLDKKDNKENDNVGLKRKREEDTVTFERESDSFLDRTASMESYEPNSSQAAFINACPRCKKKGHWIAKCPTILDPTFDRAPAPDYECVICKAVGKHFYHLCPQNNRPNSWYQRRLQAEGREQSPTLYDSFNYENRVSISPRYESPPALPRSTEIDSYRPDSSNVYPQWRKKSSDKHQRADRYRPYQTPQEMKHSSSPLHMFHERTSREAEGRLAYDNDVYANLSHMRLDSPGWYPTVVWFPQADANETHRKDEAMEETSPIAKNTPEHFVEDIPNDTPEDIPEGMLEEMLKEMPDVLEQAKRDTDEFLDGLTSVRADEPSHSPEAVGILAICSKSIVNVKTKRMKAVDFMD